MPQQTHMSSGHMAAVFITTGHLIQLRPISEFHVQSQDNSKKPVVAPVFGSARMMCRVVADSL